MGMESDVVAITINGNSYDVREDSVVVAAAEANGIYIPTLCHHPDLPPFADLAPSLRIFRGETSFENVPVSSDQWHRMEGCGLCVVEVDGVAQPARACQTKVTPGMSIRTESETLKQLRRGSLMNILERHPHACITCAQREGCSLEDCSSNVPKEERCCSKFHHCELRKVAEYVGVKEETPRYRANGLSTLNDDPLIVRDFNLCIDCARCVRICNQVRGVEALGIVHRDGRLVVGSVAPTLLESACKFCGACVEVCPTGCLADKGRATGDREQFLVPCVGTCPAGVDVPGYIRHIARGDVKAAAALVWEKLPLANVLGHICFHLCECECRRGEVDDPIAICALKRFALESGGESLWAEEAKKTQGEPQSGRKVAIIGAGPAGLAAAYFLQFQGHQVTIFDAQGAAGGMPGRSVPDYRLPRAVLDKDVAVIVSLGVKIETGRRLSGAEMTATLERGFDALLVAVGLPDAKKIALDGRDLNGVSWGLEFLTEAKQGGAGELGSEVVVVGGGNVAIDAAMTALRVSGGRVRLFCLEGRSEMPAHAQELADAEAEGVEINPGWGPTAIVGDGEKVTAIEFQKCTAVFDGQGNFAPTFDNQQTVKVGADSVVLAIGQTAANGIPTEDDRVFLAGDIAGGGMSVVHAVASGRTAAENIDRFLGGDGSVALRFGDDQPAEPWIGRDEKFAPRPRVGPPCIDPTERRADFRQIERTYSPDQAKAEADRCLQCDLRLAIRPADLPPERWQKFERDAVEQVPMVEGVFVLADADKKPTTIEGTMDIRQGLIDRLDSGCDASFFLWEEDRMYTKRESELIQQHLEQYGQLPGGGDDALDDLF